MAARMIMNHVRRVMRSVDAVTLEKMLLMAVYRGASGSFGVRIDLM